MKMAPVNKSWFVLLCAAIFGAIAVYAVNRYVQQTLLIEKAKLAPNEQMVEVVVAKGDLKKGDIVSNSSMAVRSVPKEFTTGMSIGAAQFTNVEGARLNMDMRGGEMLLRTSMEGVDATTFAMRIATGTRAMTISVDDTNSIAGLVQPGDKIDLFYSSKNGEQLSRGSGYKGDTVGLFMPSVVILATGKQVRPQSIETGGQAAARSFSTVTISVNPQQAQKLMMAQKTGTLFAILRNPQDKNTVDLPIWDSTNVVREVANAAPVVARPTFGSSAQESVDVYIGGRGSASVNQTAVGASQSSGNRDRDGSGLPTQGAAVQRGLPASLESIDPAQLGFIQQLFDSLNRGQNTNKP